MTRAEIFAAIEYERGRQAKKWAGTHAWGYGDCSSDGVHTMVKIAVLTEELGEVARAALDGGGQDTGQPNGLREELVQVAAVCVAWLEGLPE